MFKFRFYDNRNLDSYDLRYRDYLYDSILSNMKIHWEEDKPESQVVYKFIYRRFIRCFYGYKVLPAFRLWTLIEEIWCPTKI